MADQKILEVKVIEEKRGASWVRTMAGGFVVQGMPTVGDVLDNSAVILQDDDPMQATSRFYELQVLEEWAAEASQPTKSTRLWLNRQNVRILWVAVQVIVIVALIIVFGGFLIQALF